MTNKPNKCRENKIKYYLLCKLLLPKDSVPINCPIIFELWNLGEMTVHYEFSNKFWMCTEYKIQTYYATKEISNFIIT